VGRSIRVGERGGRERRGSGEEEFYTGARGDVEG